MKENLEISKRFCSGLLRCATTNCLFLQQPRKLYRFSPIDRSIRVNRSFVKPFKKEYTSTTMYTDIKRKRTISILRLCFIKERREKKIESKPCLSFLIYPLTSILSYYVSFLFCLRLFLHRLIN